MSREFKRNSRILAALEPRQNRQDKDPDLRLHRNSQRPPVIAPSQPAMMRPSSYPQQKFSSPSSYWALQDYQLQLMLLEQQNKRRNMTKDSYRTLDSSFTLKDDQESVQQQASRRPGLNSSRFMGHVSSDEPIAAPKTDKLGIQHR